MRISAIFFDLGNVLVRFHRDQVLRQLAERSSLSLAEIDHLLLTDSFFIDYELGKKTTKEALAHWKERLKFPGTEEELEYIYCNNFSPIDPHIEAVKKLAEHYPVALISNTCEAHIRQLKSSTDFLHHFRDVIYSYEVGLRKPDYSIYQLALDRLKVDRYEALFVDDLEENILTPAKNGWQTIHLRPDVDLILALQSYDLEGIRALDI